VGRWLILVYALIANASSAHAHLASDSYLRIEIAADGQVGGQWDIALRDLDVTVGLDANQDGDITWGELHAKQKEVEAYAFGRLTLARGGAPCGLTPTALQVDYHAGYAYAVLPFTAKCPITGPLTLNYRLLFDIDPSHRGLLTVVDNGAISTSVLTPDGANLALDQGPVPLIEQVGQFLQLGFEHILLGYDHLLFIAILLVPAALRRSDGGEWKPIDGLGRVLNETIKTLTAFTLAHASVLIPSVLDAINISGRLVQPAVAATIIVAGLDNLRPILPRLRWQVAFLFGLIHGLSFASTLGPMRLPAVNLAAALACFNLGVEGGQIALALLLVPIAFALRYEVMYRRFVAPSVSIAAVALAAFWAADSLFALNFLSMPSSPGVAMTR
jgi:hypothetical protein